MSEIQQVVVKPGELFRRKSENYKGLVVKARMPHPRGHGDWYCEIVEGLPKFGLAVGATWTGTIENPKYYDRLPSQSPEGPQVGGAWRWGLKGHVYTLTRRHENGHGWRFGDGPNDWFRDGSFTNGDLTRVSPASPGKAAPPAAPATPAGPPAKPVRACWKCNKRGEFPSRHHPDEPFGPSPMCEPCYLRFENRLPNCPVQDSEPLPRDHWRPAIESLGAVRPFGRPRGWR